MMLSMHCIYVSGMCMKCKAICMMILLVIQIGSKMHVALLIFAFA